MRDFRLARTRALAGLAALALIAVACGGGGGDDVVVVFAAASLTDAFGALEAEYEAQNPGVDVQLNLAGSARLRAQIDEGAPADVFAAAAPGHVEGLYGGDSAPLVFATNGLVIAVPRGNPGGVTGLQDLASEELLVGLCDPRVPCGEYAEALLAEAHVTAAPDTLEPDVRSLLAKIASGDLDAGLVYATDAGSDDRVDMIEAPETGVTATYPVVQLSDETHASGFVELLTGSTGQDILRSHGFGAR